MQEYKNKMLEAFVGKTHKVSRFQKMFNKYEDKTLNLKLNWSWNSFLFGHWFLLYRKAYLPFIAFLLLGILIGSRYFILMRIISAIANPYILYLQYKENTRKIEENITDEDQKIKRMQEIGGYNEWLFYTPLFIISFYLLIFLLGFSFMNLFFMKHFFLTII